MRAVMTQMGEPVTHDEVDAIIKEADTDGDGNINYAEFFTMFNRKEVSADSADRGKSPIKSSAFCSMSESTKRFIGTEINHFSNMPSSSSSSSSSKRSNRSRR